MLQNVKINFISDTKGLQGSINQSNQNSNTYSNIIIKQLNRLHNLRSHNGLQKN